MTNTIETKINQAITNSLKPSVATGFTWVSRQHASNLNITQNGGACVKHGKIIIPIKIRRFSSGSTEEISMVFDQNNGELIQRLS